MTRPQLLALAAFAPLTIFAGLFAGWASDAWARWQPEPVTLPTLHVVIDSHHLDYHGTERQIRPGTKRALSEEIQ